MEVPSRAGRRGQGARRAGPKAGEVCTCREHGLLGLSLENAWQRETAGTRVALGDGLVSPPPDPCTVQFEAGGGTGVAAPARSSQLLCPWRRLLPFVRSAPVLCEAGSRALWCEQASQVALRPPWGPPRCLLSGEGGVRSSALGDGPLSVISAPLRPPHCSGALVSHAGASAPLRRQGRARDTRAWGAPAQRGASRGGRSWSTGRSRGAHRARHSALPGVRRRRAFTATTRQACGRCTARGTCPHDSPARQAASRPGIGRHTEPARK